MLINEFTRTRLSTHPVIRHSYMFCLAWPLAARLPTCLSLCLLFLYTTFYYCYYYFVFLSFQFVSFNSLRRSLFLFHFILNVDFRSENNFFLFRLNTKIKLELSAPALVTTVKQWVDAEEVLYVYEFVQHKNDVKEASIMNGCSGMAVNGKH